MSHIRIPLSFVARDADVSIARCQGDSRNICGKTKLAMDVDLKILARGKTGFNGAYLVCAASLTANVHAPGLEHVPDFVCQEKRRSM